MNFKDQWSGGRLHVCISVCACAIPRCTPTPSADISRPSGTFNQPGVKHAEGQMRRKLHSSGAEIMLHCLFAWFFCAAQPAAPHNPSQYFVICYFCWFVSLMWKGFVCLFSTLRTKANADDAKLECIYKLPLWSNPVIAICSTQEFPGCVDVCACVDNST